MRRLSVVMLAVCAILSIPSADGVILNLTNVADFGTGTEESTLTVGDVNPITLHGGFINEAFYRRTETTQLGESVRSGSGQFRDYMVVTGNTSAVAGYNRDGILDGKSSNGFTEFITVGDLRTDNSGDYYVFGIDVNEPGNTPARFISMDDFRIYSGDAAGTITNNSAAGDPTPLPQTLGELETTFTNLYRMSPDGEQNHVLIDYQLNSGSGTMDLLAFVPVSRFDGLTTDTLIYTYFEFGGYTAPDGTPFIQSSGGEQIALPPDVETYLRVPEPSTSLLLMGGLLTMCVRRRRNTAA